MSRNLWLSIVRSRGQPLHVTCAVINIFTKFKASAAFLFSYKAAWMDRQRDGWTNCNAKRGLLWRGRLSLCVCVEEISSSDVDVGVIVSCAVGASFCILIIAISIFLIISNRRQATLDKQRQRIVSERMQRVWSVVSHCHSVTVLLSWTKTKNRTKN